MTGHNSDHSNRETERILRERAQWDLLRRLMPMLSDDEIAEEVAKARKAIQKKLLADFERRKGRSTVPINDTLFAALTTAKAEALSDYVVEWGGERVRSIKRSIETAARNAGLKEVSPHVFRHTAAVWMAEAGVPLTEIAQYLGHSTPSITYRVYSRYSPDHLRGAAKALEMDVYEVPAGPSEPASKNRQ